ncbi:MAG: hypothetical protein V4685_05665 [Bacteroidota bacterium]
MKAITKNIILKSLLLFILMLSQAQAWAFNGDESNDMGRWERVAHMPAFWAGVVVLLGFIVSASLLSREKKENELQ